ncbi:hypothetical protein ABK040_007630 [Willaertia magna]
MTPTIITTNLITNSNCSEMMKINNKLTISSTFLLSPSDNDNGNNNDNTTTTTTVNNIINDKILTMYSCNSSITTTPKRRVSYNCQQLNVPSCQTPIYKEAKKQMIRKERRMMKNLQTSSLNVCRRLNFDNDDTFLVTTTLPTSVQVIAPTTTIPFNQNSNKH